MIIYVYIVMRDYIFFAVWLTRAKRLKLYTLLYICLHGTFLELKNR